MSSENESKRLKLDDEKEDVNIIDIDVQVDTNVEKEEESEEESDEWSGSDEEQDYIDVNYNPYDDNDLRDFECLICHCKDNKISKVDDDSYWLVCIGCVRNEIPNYKDNLYARSWLNQCGPQKTHKDRGDDICVVCNNKCDMGFYMPLCRDHEADYCF